MYVVKHPHLGRVYTTGATAFEAVQNYVNACHTANQPLTITGLAGYGDRRSGLQTTIGALRGELAMGIPANIEAIIDVEDGQDPALAVYDVVMVEFDGKFPIVAT
jgi:hypothetical protein